MNEEDEMEFSGAMDLAGVGGLDSSEIVSIGIWTTTYLQR